MPAHGRLRKTRGLQSRHAAAQSWQRTSSDEGGRGASVDAGIRTREYRAVGQWAAAAAK
jgi:hypothetical protein